MKKIITTILLITSSFLSVNAQYTKLLDFSGSANGSTPAGSLISDGTYLYGMTYYGGTNNMGVVFKIKPDGTGYSKLLDFNGTSNGKYAYASLISDGTFLYGMTTKGGTNDKGVVFKIKPDGTGYTKLLDFSGVTNGSIPWGSLVSDGTFLYGMTQYGGTGSCTTGCGTLFKIMPDGTGFTKLLDFTGAANGSGPTGSLIFDGTFLYGMTVGGGINNKGVVFKIMPDGTGYSKLLDFDGTTNGNLPFGDLIADGINLYGMSWQGGANNFGVIFNIKSDGTGYTKLHDFGGVNGKYPNGALLSEGAFQYGMTYNGGLSDSGTVFKIMPNGTGYSKLLDFSGSTNGSRPAGSFISDGTFLYGMTQHGGIHSAGTIFKYALSTNEIAEKNMSNGFNLFPNPSNGTFTIASKATDYTLIITNVLGENIYQSEIKNQKSEIDLSKQPKGIYFVKIYYGEKIHLEKIVVQ